MNDELRDWSSGLAEAMEPLVLFDRVTVLAETDSTQDAARRLNVRPGQVVVAGRQLRGRGRRGRAWDSGENDGDGEGGGGGVAMSIVLAPDRPERLVISSAVAVAEALGGLLFPEGALRRPGIKWPNDVMVDGRKLAGILIEQDQARAIVGIGINVRQMRWPADLEGAAISLAQLGVEASRLAVMTRVLEAMDAVARASDADVAARYRGLDVLRGSRASFQHDGRVIEGVVREVDPARGLSIELAAGVMQWLPASATTRIG